MGYTEVQLLGQNVNSYFDPSAAGWDFATLLRNLGQLPGMRRVRFTTSHPRDFVKEIVDAIDENPVLCNHVHLPVQSGSTRILGRMQRLYTRDEYMQRVGWMKNGRNIAITTDIIVGFPGETEADFEETLSLLDEVEFDAVFGFKYSRRPNTPALAYEDQIAEDEKIRRLSVVLEKQRAIQIRRNAVYVGQVEEVLVEGYHQSLKQWIGRTAQNKTLNFFDTAEPGSGSILGTYLPVRVTRAGPNALVGESI
jgi:tRNA-2-methylthio-N6-dimethylallyladenosine synthase